MHFSCCKPRLEKGKEQPFSALEKLKKGLDLIMETKGQAVFEINGRFEVKRHNNSLFDRERNICHRLEPRLMRLLCLLIDNQEQVVTRESIINQIWNDYPGAGEGLNQGISHLRKILEDDTKTIIHTVPKTGYQFQAIAASGKEKVNQDIPLTNTSPWKYTLWAAIVVAIIFFAWTFFTADSPVGNLEEDKRISSIDEARQNFRADEKEAEDSLVFTKAQVLHFANLYVNNINDKMKKDSMEFWTIKQEEWRTHLLLAKKSLDSLRKSTRVLR
jgi:DNA-binding winged helix-turn-helix (wHTH) protein